MTKKQGKKQTKTQDKTQDETTASIIPEVDLTTIREYVQQFPENVQSKLHEDLLQTYRTMVEAQRTNRSDIAEYHNDLVYRTYDTVREFSYEMLALPQTDDETLRTLMAGAAALQLPFLKASPVLSAPIGVPLAASIVVTDEKMLVTYLEYIDTLFACAEDNKE